MTEPSLVPVYFDTRLVPRLIEALHVARSIIEERLDDAPESHPIHQDHVQLVTLIRVLEDVRDAPEAKPIESWIQWQTIYVGGGQGEGVSLMTHKACGCYVSDMARHQLVCTAPPWEPPPIDPTPHDYHQNGTRT